jgi:Fe-S cluster assembly iron-binding protein IscA
MIEVTEAAREKIKDYVTNNVVDGLAIRVFLSSGG